MKITVINERNQKKKYQDKDMFSRTKSRMKKNFKKLISMKAEKRPSLTLSDTYFFAVNEKRISTA